MKKLKFLVVFLFLFFGNEMLVSASNEVSNTQYAVLLASEDMVLSSF